MGKASTSLMRLRPVTFRYKKAKPKDERRIQYGLIAEEVAEVYPDLVIYDDAGEAQTVMYHQLPVMLLNELQKQHRQIQEQKNLIANLTERLTRLEGLVTERTTLSSLAK